MEKQTTQSCPACGGKMILETKTEALEYKGRTTEIQSEGWWCGSCGEGILAAEALKASERAFEALKAEVDDPPSAAAS